MSIQKLVLRGTSKMSLHARFTQLAYQAPKEQPAWEREARAHTEPVDRKAVAGRSRERERASAVPRVERQASPPPGYRKRQEDSSVGLALRRLHDRSATIAAATRIKNRSIRQRLGVRARLTLPSYPPFPPYPPAYRYQNGSSPGYLERVPAMPRWGSTESVYGGRQPFRRRWAGPVGRARPRFLPMRRRGGGRWLGGRQQGAGRRGGVRRGVANRRPPPPSREQLDQELDSYMSGTRSVLDKQLDDYRMEADVGS